MIDKKNENSKLIDAGSPGFEELIDLCIELDVTFMLCEAGLKLCKINPSLLRSDIKISSGGLYSLMKNNTPEDKLLFI